MSESNPSETEPVETPPSASDEAKAAELISTLQRNQNFPLAIVAGIVSCLAGGGIWGAVTVATGYQIGWMAVAVGALVGFSIRFLGKGIEQKFGYAGAFFALLGCLLGNIFAQAGFIASEYDSGFFSVLFSFNLDIIIEIFTVTFSPIDLLFYGIAVYEGYKFSFQQLDDAQIATLQG